MRRGLHGQKNLVTVHHARQVEHDINDEIRDGRCWRGISFDSVEPQQRSGRAPESQLILEEVRVWNVKAEPSRELCLRR